MAKYRKKPVIIEAIQWTGENELEIVNFVGESLREIKNKIVKIDTLEGTMNASVGDWIIKGIRNEFYPCKPDVFEKTYEFVE